MDRATYETLCQGALTELEHLIAIGVDPNNIVGVITCDVFQAAVRYKRYWRTSWDEREMVVLAKFNGYDVGVINEHNKTGMFRFAVRGMNYIAGMNHGTLIVVNDDNVTQLQLYELDRVDAPAVQFSNTGLTVSFRSDRILEGQAATVAADTADDIFIRGGLGGRDFLSMPIEDIFKFTRQPFATEYEYRWIPSWYEHFQRVPSQYEHFQIPEKTKTRDIGHVNIEPKKQAKVKPDTSALDEFLGSFKVLKSAT